jgi:NADH:ubiquinone oxidoreductase subunit 2 (subunit N)
MSQKNQETERRIKYFIAQAVGSRVIITISFLIFSTPLQNNVVAPTTYLIFILAMLLKLGVGPLHFWFPSVIVGLRWPIAFLLST